MRVLDMPVVGKVTGKSVYSFKNDLFVRFAHLGIETFCGNIMRFGDSNSKPFDIFIDDYNAFVSASPKISLAPVISGKVKGEKLKTFREGHEYYNRESLVHLPRVYR